MLNNYKLVKSYELEALQQENKDLHEALTEATNLLDRAGKIVEEQRQLINTQQDLIMKAIRTNNEHIYHDIEFPNSMKGGYPDQ